MRLALAQINPTVGDLGGNAAKIAGYYHKAREAGADLVLFPELAVTGYPPEDLLLRREFLKASVRQIEHLASGLQGGAAALIGAPRLDNGSLHNSCCIVQKGRILGWYDKISLPNYGVFDEKRYFEPGNTPSILIVNDVPIAVNICEDSWDPEGPYKRQIQAGAQMIVNLSASPFHRNKSRERIDLMSAIAREAAAPFAYCNLVGGQDELVFDGGSFVLDAAGGVTASMPLFAEDILVVDVDAGKGVHSANPDLPVITAENTGECKHGAVNAGKAKALSEVDEIMGAVVLGTQDYVHKNGFRKAVIGVSGGIDSAVALCVAVKALGKENVTGMIMPGPFSSGETQSDAETVCRNAGTGIIKAPIDKAFQAIRSTLEQATGNAPQGLAEENLQARIRGLLLMTVSNSTGALVLTTGNKSETATGYSTLYGDTAGAFAPLKDIPKTMVWRLAERCNEIEQREVIPRSIIERVPSAELRPNQKDEDSLPPYDVLDRILEAYIEQGMSISEMIEQGLPEEEIHRTLDMIDRSEYKRVQAPPGVKITPHAFGKDWRRPVTNRFRVEENQER